MSGTSLLMPDRFLQPEPLCKFIGDAKPTLSAAVPTIWQGVLSWLEDHPRDLAPLAKVIVGGSACPPVIMHAFKEKYNVDIVHAWGMTETSPLGTISYPPAGVTEEEFWEYKAMQGRFSSSVEARLIGPDEREVSWDGESTGELEVRGPWITGSYYGGSTDPEKFRDGWLRTGDVGSITTNGYLRLTDRAKDVIKSGGEWISSVELENRLLEHPSVAEAAVIGIPDIKWDERPLATVVVKAGTTVTAAELRDFLSQYIAKWQLPDAWSFIETVPKTSVGKFDKKKLRAEYAAGDLTVEKLD
jgi:fatty-acyl-CoA synthase